LLDAFDIPYTFSDPMVLALTLHKGMAKRVVRDLGVPTPDFAVVERASDLASIALPFPLFAKPVAEGTGKGVTAASKMSSEEELLRVVPELLERFRQPVLVETFLPGREFTVGIVGTGPEAEALGAMEVFLKPEAEAEVYSYVNKERCEELVEYRLARDDAADQAMAVALAAWRGLGCRDAGRVDLRADAQGVPQFLEVNPLAGLHPQHSDLPILCTLLGMAYEDLLGRIVRSAAARASRRP
jgi:D-alanine-D-alanine ligase